MQVSFFWDLQVLDRVSGEQVGLMFDAVDQSLYDGYSTGFNQMDWECLEWKNKFPHLRLEVQYYNQIEFVSLLLIVATVKSSTYLKNHCLRCCSLLY